MDIAAWLTRLGLGEYVRTFHDNHIDRDVLIGLTDADLRELRVTSLGHRKTLLAAIAAIRASVVTEGVSGATRSTGESASLSAPGAAREAERRQLTVLFADLVESTAFAQAVDPEDLREVIRHFQDSATAAVSRYDGYVAKFMGDGVLAYFGWPVAHEDDAERAIRAGIALIDGVHGRRRGGRPALDVRVGIATGLVVVGDIVGEGGAREQAAVGETLNLAARLEKSAAPGTVVVAPATRALLGQVFELDSLGVLELKGISNPVEAWRVGAARSTASRFEAVRGHRLSRFIGREQELECALARWEEVKLGKGCALLLRAEPGIGKSRFVAELCQRIESEAAATLLYQCSPHHVNGVLYPVMEQISRAARLDPVDPFETRLEKLERFAAQFNVEPATAIPVLARMLSIPCEDSWPAPAWTPQQWKAATLTLLVDLLAARASDGPLLVIVEDLHWADPTTRELLDQVVDRIETLPLMMLVTLRPEIATPWEGSSRTTLVTLDRLAQGQAEALAAETAQGKQLPPEVLGRILERTDGVPLFVEELTKSILESGLLTETKDGWQLAGRAGELTIPSSLQTSLVARLDRLASAREVAQIGAALGREFDFGLLAAVAPGGEGELADALTLLHRAELVFPRGAPPRTRWMFKHTLVQEAAYGTLLKSKRAALHAKIAAAIEQSFPALAETQPQLLAHHYTEAGMFAAAIRQWDIAGQNAAYRSALSEAVVSFSNALRLLDGATDLADREKIEIAVRLRYGPALMMLRGFAAAEVEAVYLRANALCRRLGSPEQQYVATWGLCLVYQHRGRLALAAPYQDELHTVAARTRDSSLMLEAHHSSFISAGLLGDWQGCVDHAHRALALYRDEQRASYLRFGGHDPGLCAQSTAAIALIALGHPDRGQRTVRRAVARARTRDHLPDLVVTLFTYANVGVWLRDPDLTVRAAEEMLSCAKRLENAEYVATARIFRGWGLVRRDGTALAIPDIGESIDARLRIGSEARHSYFLWLMADALLASGALVEASRTLDRADAFIVRSGEQAFRSLVGTLRGRIALLEGDLSDALSSFESARDVARAQGARWLELRAEIGRTMVMLKRGHRVQARAALEPIYNWFSEGFGTSDMKEAKALLGQLDVDPGRWK